MEESSKMIGSGGREYLAIPGPSVLPDRVLNAMHRAAPDIYGGELVDIFPSIVADLKKIAGTETKVAMYSANGHGGWEAALTNTLSKGDHILVLDTGRFGRSWAMIAQRLGLRVHLLEFGPIDGIDHQVVLEKLACAASLPIKAVLACHVDTSSGLRIDLKSLSTLVQRAPNKPILMIDGIASFGCEELRMDDWGLDVVVASSQKGLMVPPGLSFVFLNEKAEAYRQNADLVAPYWDWKNRLTSFALTEQFFGTPPTHLLFALRTALDMIIQEEGLERVWARHALLANSIWAAVETWTKPGGVALTLGDRSLRCHAVTNVAIPAPNGEALRQWLFEHSGVTLGTSLFRETSAEQTKLDYFRIGHMGHFNASMILGLLGCLQAGFLELGIPHNPGAIDAASHVLVDGLKLSNIRHHSARNVTI